jgi:hypothetical protein
MLNMINMTVLLLEVRNEQLSCVKDNLREFES